MKTDGATGPLGRSIIYIYSSRSKNIFIKCKCMTTISSFVGRILTTENLWCSQFPSFRFFLYSDNALHWAHPMTWLFMFNLLSGPGGKKNRQKERRLMKGFLAAGGKLPPPQANPPQRWSWYFAQCGKIHQTVSMTIIWQSFVRAPSPPALPQQNNNKSWWETFKIYRKYSHTCLRFHSFGVEKSFEGT